MSLYTLGGSALQVFGGVVALGFVALEGEDVLVDCVENVGWIGEEGILNFIGWRDPVACPQHHGRSVQLPEPELRDFGRHGLQAASPFARIAGQQNPARLLEGFGGN